jgi:hypothetical protein
VFILINCATYFFNLHGFYTSTYVANITYLLFGGGRVCGNTKRVLPGAVELK